MNIIDTHSHIYTSEFADDIAEVIERARLAGVSAVLMPNIDIESISPLHTLAEQYPDYCIPMMGLHPTSITEDWESVLENIHREFSARKYIAVGEIGVDLYWDKTLEKQQCLAFEEQLRWSIEHDLPVAIHSRNAVGECVDCIKRIGADQLRGVFHSFGGSMEEMQEVLALGNFLLGINGTVTFKNSILPSILPHARLSDLIIETDAPYLAPMPYRGKRNEPSYTVQVVRRLADIYRLSEEEIAEVTTDNAKKLFGLEK